MNINKQTITSTLVVLLLIIGIGYFVLTDLRKEEENNPQDVATTTPETTETEKDKEDSEIITGEIPPEIIPGLDREFVIPQIFGEETIKATMEQYELIVSGLEKDPSLRGDWLQLAILRKAVEDYEGAEEIWIYLTKVYALDHVSFGNLGDLYMNYLVDLDKAETNFLEAIGRRTDNQGYYENLYNLYRHRLGESEKAVSLLLEGHKIFPNNLFFLVRIAEHYRDTDNNSKAREYFEKTRDKAIELGDGDIESYAKEELSKL